MLKEIMTFTTLAILALTLACGTADEPTAEVPSPTPSGAAQTGRALPTAGSGATVDGTAVGVEITGTAVPITDNASAPLTLNPPAASQDAVPATPATKNEDALPADPATGTQDTAPGQLPGQQEATEKSNTAMNSSLVPAATLLPTPVSCWAMTEVMWLNKTIGQRLRQELEGIYLLPVAGYNASEDFWSNADAAQVTNALDCGANVGASNQLGATPLHLAAGYSKDPAVVQLLLDNGAGPDIVTTLGTPLVLAARYNSNPKVIQVLLDNGADPNNGGRSWPPIYYAAVNSNPEVTQTLLDSGADLVKGQLHFAARHNRNPEVIRILLDNGVDVEAIVNDYTPLQVTAEYSDNPAVVQALLDGGADVEGGVPAWKDSVILSLSPRHLGPVRHTPLRLATERNGNPEIAQVLLDAGADLEATFEFYLVLGRY